MEKSACKPEPRNNRTIVIPIEQDDYSAVVENPAEFRRALDGFIESSPELFPSNILSGYTMKDTYNSKKLSVKIRRIEISGVSYTVRPCFVMPYMAGKADDVEKAIFLRKFSVPFWALAHVFGKNQMYWYRLEASLGRNSIVGTTVKNPELLPENIAADEKHTSLCGEKAYIATTVANECILGVSVKKDAGENSLTDAYGVFKEESQALDPGYSPQTVNTDGWKATQNAWKNLFPSIVIISCFLHFFIKIRDCCKNKCKDVYDTVVDKVWNCYHAENKASFSQRARRLYEWALNNAVSSAILQPIKKFRDKLSKYSGAYDHPGAHRTSNMLDRLMRTMDRHLFATCYFHGSLYSAELNLRGWACIQNFAPSNPWTVKQYAGLKSPAERLNGFCYHENWLKNLLISSSLAGENLSPQNPL